jgi:hypothetical protein
LEQIKDGKAVHNIKLDTTVGTLRDRSVSWIVQAINDLNNPAVIMRVRPLLPVYLLHSHHFIVPGI